ncbi:conjugal transfer protein TraD [Sphingosinicella sp.]|uniref:conjugal transfer protein TraD n=1 Tax=Sphingosinicella sp. TaxID=1917971 RepID=UPI0017F09FA2|nr:conjugal transfer protein TraD [Sphingosinicella sp.]MBA4758154.1 conjugal transfer protein TraD [Sphingosinicella sp.]
MRRPRDYDAEMKLLADKAKALQDRKLRELGQLVTATGADTLGADVLAGVLITAAAATDMVQREEWRTAGAAFFLRGKQAQAGTAKATARREAAPRSPQSATGAADAG